MNEYRLVVEKHPNGAEPIYSEIYNGRRIEGATSIPLGETREVAMQVSDNLDQIITMLSRSRTTKRLEITVKIK